MIRLTRIAGDKRTPGRLVTSGDVVVDLPDTNASWGQISRTARELGLAPPDVDMQTQELVYKRAPDFEARWETNVETQREALRQLEHRAAVARGALVRLGEEVEGPMVEYNAPAPTPAAMRRGRMPPKVPAPPPGPSLVSPPPPAPERAAPTLPPPAPDPAPATLSDAPLPAPVREPLEVVELLEADPDTEEDVRDAETLALAAVMADAREKGQWAKLAVCTFVVEGRAAALAIEELSPKARSSIKSMSIEKARAECAKWVAEAAR